MLINKVKTIVKLDSLNREDAFRFLQYTQTYTIPQDFELMKNRPFPGLDEKRKHRKQQDNQATSWRTAIYMADKDHLKQ